MQDATTPARITNGRAVPTTNIATTVMSIWVTVSSTAATTMVIGSIIPLLNTDEQKPVLIAAKAATPMATTAQPPSTLMSAQRSIVSVVIVPHATAP